MKKQWIKLIVVTVLYLAFLIWVKSWMGLVVLPFIYDAYITKKIKWTWWKDSDNPIVVNVMSWVDAIVFAAVAIYFVNLFFFQNFVIPSSSLEKSLLVGDYLFVSKMSYGPRIPQTPLTLPLTQHTIPVLECKSFLEHPHWDYRRVKGFGPVKLNDIVVFNYPSGDTVLANPQFQAGDYTTMCYAYGESSYREEMGNNFPDMASLSRENQMAAYNAFYNRGREILIRNRATFGERIYRPEDRRECYVKRCVGLPGQTLQIKDRTIYLNGEPQKQPENVQFNYLITFKQSLPEEVIRQLGLSEEDLITQRSSGYMPLTQKSFEALSKMTDYVESIALDKQTSTDGLYPHNIYTGWTCDNYGPVVIPAKGQTIKLNMDNIAVYERPIRVYENNDVKVENGKIYINGQQTDSYTFKMDYYWMMGDNRHNSADSRYWGFVPEDHIVGKPIFVWLSLDKDRSLFDGKVRWNRIFKMVDNIK